MIFVNWELFSDEGADPLKKYKKEQILERYKEIEKKFRESINSEQSCTNVDPSKFSDTCSFSKLCSVFEENIEKPYLYINNKGGKIPNYFLPQLESSVAGCFMFVSSKIDQKDAQPVPFEVQQQKILIKSHKARLELVKAVRKHKMEEEFLKFEQEVSEISLKEAEGGSPGLDNYLNINHAQVEADFLKICKKIGVNFPTEIKEKYINSVMTMFNGGTPVSSPANALNYPKTVFQSPFLSNDLLYDVKAAGSEAKVKKNQEVVKKSIKRAEEIFLKTQEDVINLLDKRAIKNPQNKIKYEEMKKRVSTIRYKPSVNCVSPNAYYDPSSHTFNLCPQILEMPQSSLKSVVAHEIAHSIDPCLMSFPFLELSNKKRKENGLFSNSMSDEQMKEMGYIPFKLEEKSYKKHFAIDYLGEAEKQLSAEYEFSNLKKIGEGIDFVEFPESNVLDCLSKKDSLGVRASSKNKTLEWLKNEIKRLKQSGMPDSNPQLSKLIELRDNFNSIYEKHGACSILPGNSQQQEGWSDWVAGEIIGEDIKSNNNESLERAFESFGFFTSLSCNYNESSIFKKANKFLKDMGCTMPHSGSSLADSIRVLSHGDKHSDSHSHSIDRVEKLFLGQPEIKKALGCNKKSGGRHCD